MARPRIKSERREFYSQAPVRLVNLMKTALLFLLTLTGCHAYPYHCYYGPILFLSDQPLDCDAIRNAGEGLRAAYAQTDWLDRWGGFDEAFQGYSVVALPGSTINCAGKEVVACNDHSTTYLGGYYPTALAHESLHFLECRAGDCYNAEHTGWKERGYVPWADAFRRTGPAKSWIVRDAYYEWRERDK